MILKVFSGVKQRVIMKWESDVLEGKPDNVMIGSWLPQSNILSHKNVRLFISHCGLGSTVEAKYYGVPIVGIPIGCPLFEDQDSNIDMIVNEGWGVKVDFAGITQRTLFGAVQEVLNNPKYSHNAKKLSKLFRDRPMTPKETATYWVEYVIRHRGAPHIQYPGVHLNFWQSNSLDVILFLVVSSFFITKFITFAFKFLFSPISNKLSFKTKLL